MIVYKNIKSPLGDMIAGATENGACFLEWHDRGGVERIKKRVGKRYKMELTEGTNEHLELLEKEVENYFCNELTKFTVPLDTKGTKFEMLIWGNLLDIKYGETFSYGQIAEKAGNKNASRAVGKANGSNYLSIIIPCHRVIEANGKLRGYGGGLDRKRYLLDLESNSLFG